MIFLAHGFKDFGSQMPGGSLWSSGKAESHGRKHVVEQSSLHHGGQEGRGRGTAVFFTKACPWY